MKSKTIILSNPNERDKSRGILTIYEEDDIFKCRMRLYEHEKLSKYCKLGIYQNEVFSANLLEKNGTYLSSIVGDFDLNKDFYSAIVDTENNNKPLLAGGTYSGLYFTDNSMFSTIEPDNYKDHFYKDDEDIKEIIDQEITTLDEQPEPETISQDISEDPALVDPTPKQTINTDNIKDLLTSITEQFDYVFKHYPADETLNKMLPNSQFVNIKENEDHYSIGVLTNNENIKYICYAKFCLYNTPAPVELGEHYQWLPLDAEDPLSDGYYIVFQDTTDLKIVQL